jgi:hypothetical protein
MPRKQLKQTAINLGRLYKTGNLLDDIDMMTGELYNSSDTKLNNALFDTYTGSTRTELDNINNNIIILSGSTSGSTGNGVSVTLFNTYTGDTNTILNNKLNISDFNIYTGNTNNVSTTLFNTYTGNTENKFNYISGVTDTKLNISNFNIYSGNTQTELQKTSTLSPLNLSPGLNIINLNNIAGQPYYSYNMGLGAITLSGNSNTLFNAYAHGKIITSGSTSPIFSGITLFSGSFNNTVNGTINKWIIYRDLDENNIERNYLEWKQPD